MSCEIWSLLRSRNTPKIKPSFYLKEVGIYSFHNDNSKHKYEIKEKVLEEVIVRASAHQKHEKYLSNSYDLSSAANLSFQNPL